MQSKNNNLLVQYYKLCVAVRNAESRQQNPAISNYEYNKLDEKLEQMRKAKMEIRNFIRGKN